MADEQLWPTPRYAEEIVFEGCARLAIAPEEYEALYNAHADLRAQLAAKDAEMRNQFELDGLRVLELDAEVKRLKDLAGQAVKNWNFYTGSPGFWSGMHDAMCEMRAALQGRRARDG